MTDVTTAQIVEASAKAMYERRPEPGITWESLDRGVRVEYRRDAQAALSAMFPLIRKQLADEVRADLVTGDDGAPVNPFGLGQEYAARLIEKVGS